MGRRTAGLGDRPLIHDRHPGDPPLGESVSGARPHDAGPDDDERRLAWQGDGRVGRRSRGGHRRSSGWAADPQMMAPDTFVDRRNDGPYAAVAKPRSNVAVTGTGSGLTGHGVGVLSRPARPRRAARSGWRPSGPRTSTRS